MQDFIRVKGAKEHNLQNVSVDLPKNKLVVLTGLSGSGKSSFAFDTLYAEGQRRYVESLSSYARQFLGVMKKPDVESIEGLSPAISIDQKTVSHNPRSTVGTITEIYDYLRLLFARIGHPHCPKCGIEIAPQSVDQIFHRILNLAQDQFNQTLIKQQGVRLFILSPIVRGRKGEFTQLFSSLRAKGFSRVRIDGKVFDLTDDIGLLKNNKHTIEVIIDRLILTKADFQDHSGIRSRLTSSIESALSLSDGLLMLAFVLDEGFEFPARPEKFIDHLFSQKLACPTCNLTLPEIEPRIFSFNTPHGACPNCSGIGSLLKIDQNLILNPNLTISEGGILPFNRMLENGGYFFNLIESMAQAHNFDLTTPIGEMKQVDLDKVLYGTGSQFYKISGTNSSGRSYTWEQKYEGVVKNLERRYLETKSDFIRTEIAKYMRKEICPVCHGTRLKEESLAVVITGKNIAEIAELPIKKTFSWIETLVSPTISDKEIQISAPIIKELKARLNFLLSVGLDYLTLSRMAGTLAGGEGQRIRLASQIGSGLSGVLYVLDEPSIGLHQRDNARLISTLKNLRDLGNTVVVVEHDMDTMKNADYIIDFGPLAGLQGGEVVAYGTPDEIQSNPNSLTGKYLSGAKKIYISNRENSSDELGNLVITGCKQNNLKNITATFPLGKLVVVTGVSGSGKSTLINDTLYHALATAISPRHTEKAGTFDRLEGASNIKRVSMIDQSPIGRTPRSNPATYTKAFDHIRNIFSLSAEAKIRGYKPGRFSFNVRGGRCEACQGEGQIKIEMQFLPDIYIDCEVCGGSRYNHETLEVHFKNKNIAEILDMTVEESMKFFRNYHQISEKLKTMYEVGLGYIKLGQPAPTLSGGEAQRIKLSAELSKNSSTHTVYLLDEPTTGLHFADLEKLLLVLKKLVAKNNTVIVIEHNLDLIKNADYIIDLGPEGGDGGGEIIATGSPAEIATNPASETGKFLRKIL